MLQNVISIIFSALIAHSVSYAEPLSSSLPQQLSADVDQWTICVIRNRNATHKECTEERLSTARVPFTHPDDPPAIRDSAVNKSEAWVARSAVALVNNRNIKMTRGTISVSIDYLSRVIDVDLTYVE